MALAVPVSAGDRVTIRMPSATERQAYHLADDEPAIEIRRPNGTVEVHGAGLTEVVFIASNPEPSESSPTAKRQRIVADVRRAVDTGGLRPGDQLPNEEQLVSRYDASRTAVRRALADIRKLGLARVDRATGTWVVHPETGQPR